VHNLPNDVAPPPRAPTESAVDSAGSAALGNFDPELECASCGAHGLTIFHEQPDIPVHSVQLVNTYEEARSFARGDLRLAVCGGCGFITNAAYDDALQDYASAYEDAQGFSPRFQEFSRELAARWIDRYDLRGKTVLEIGSGKGAFLVDMCELGVRSAVGIDPAYVEGRLTSDAADRITFIPDFYSEAHGHLIGDAVVCRHTLEHIHAPRGLLQLVARSLAGRPNTPVLFELPDALRVLEEGAFWDVYYEHCSYFTPGSLARLFRLAGYEVLDLELVFDNQYVVIECRLGSGAQTGELALEEPPAEVLAAVRRFRASIAETKRRWAGRLDTARVAGERVVIWGASSKGVSFLTTLGIEREIDYAVDINPHKHGKFMAGTGQRIVGPEFLRDYRPDLVIAMNPIYLDEIGAQLSSMDLGPELVAV
jgi:SAM-dependent methyltransferase